MFWLVVCEMCTPVLPTPFNTEEQRAEWVVKHTAATGHKVWTLDRVDTFTPTA